MSCGRFLGLLLTVMMSVSLLCAQKGNRSIVDDSEKPDLWRPARGNRMQEPLSYLKAEDPETKLQEPLKSKVNGSRFIVYDDFRGEWLRLYRNKDHIALQLRTTVEPGGHGKLKMDGDRYSKKNLTLFFGKEMMFGKYRLYDEIRVFNDPVEDQFPVAVIRFRGPDTGVIFIDPLGSGYPLGVVNFSSAPIR